MYSVCTCTICTVTFVCFLFRLVGRPMTQNGNKVVKNMVCSIYAEKEGSEEAIRIKVFFVNAILDSVEVSIIQKNVTYMYSKEKIVIRRIL